MKENYKRLFFYLVILFIIVACAILLSNSLLFHEIVFYLMYEYAFPNVIWFFIIPIVLILAFFAGMIYAGYTADECLNKGEMRRSIAGAFVAGFIILVFLSLLEEFQGNDIVTAYIQLTGVVIGFYFGTRSALTGQKDTSIDLKIENEKFDFDDKGEPNKIKLNIRNAGDADVRIDRVYLNGDDIDIDPPIHIEPQRSGTVEFFKTWDPEKEYEIKVATTTGYTVTKNVVSPKHGEPERESL